MLSYTLSSRDMPSPIFFVFGEGVLCSLWNSTVEKRQLLCPCGMKFCEIQEVMEQWAVNHYKKNCQVVVQWCTQLRHTNRLVDLNIVPRWLNLFDQALDIFCCCSNLWKLEKNPYSTFFFLDNSTENRKTKSSHLPPYLSKEQQESGCLWCLIHSQTSFNPKNTDRFSWIDSTVTLKNGLLLFQFSRTKQFVNRDPNNYK